MAAKPAYIRDQLHEKANREIELKEHELYRRKVIGQRVAAARRKLEAYINEAIRLEKFEVLTEQEIANYLSKVSDLKQKIQLIKDISNKT